MLSLLQLIDTAASQAADKVVLDWWMTLVLLLLVSTVLFAAGRFCKSRSTDWGIGGDEWSFSSYCFFGLSAFLVIYLIVHACFFSTLLYPEAAVLLKFAQ